jgi:1-acyl-sn-glycerol-3-phosphate acyltransferase
VVSTIRASTRGLVTAGTTAVLLANAELAERRVPAGDRAALFDRHLRRWAHLQLRVLGVDLRVEGTPPSDRRARLVVSSHRTAIDILVAQALFGGRILSRADLATWPILGALAQRCGTIFVDREDRASGASAIRQIRRHLTAGDTITVFPEGTTHRGDDVHELKAGVFAAIGRLDVEIVPIGLAYPPGVEYWQESFLSHLGRFAGRRRTAVGVAIGQPRIARQRPAELARSLHEEVQALTHRARSLVRDSDR